MNKSNLALAALVVLLGACAPMPPEKLPPRIEPGEGFDVATTRAPTLCEVKVFILDDQITVDQEPVAIRRCGIEIVTITWTLPAKLASGPNYTFPGNGISFKGHPVPAGVRDCKPIARDKVFTCSFNRPVRGTHFSYAVTVLKDGVALPVLDPMIFNN